MLTASTGLLPIFGETFYEPVSIYTGLLGQIGDIVMFTPTVRRIKDIFPNSAITFAVSRKYREAGELVAGLPKAAGMAPGTRIAYSRTAHSRNSSFPSPPVIGLTIDPPTTNPFASAHAFTLFKAS